MTLLDSRLFDALCCPADGAWPLKRDDDHRLRNTRTGELRCPECDRPFAVRDGLVSFLSAQELTEQDHRERAMRDDESAWYDAMFEGYTDAVEVPTAVRRVGRPAGPVLDAGCGTGRITEALLSLGQAVLAVDYSETCLRRMLGRVGDAPVLAVQSDLRALPVRAGAMAAATCIEVYSQFRTADRAVIISELARVLARDAVLSISAFNYNLLFRAWHARGNAGAREGEHMLGGDYYYFRFTKDEFRSELAACFDVEEVTGVRNIPARTVAGALHRVGLRRAGDRFLDFMVARGHKADFALERLPAVADRIGFFWQARARKASMTTRSR
ncbi:MAG: methyltransferase domain-containing protein [Acidimicrobiales bacterium]